MTEISSTEKKTSYNRVLVVTELLVNGTQCNVEQPKWPIHLTCTASGPVRLRVECCKPYQYVNLLGDQVLQISMVIFSPRFLFRHNVLGDGDGTLTDRTGPEPIPPVKVPITIDTM